MSHDIGCQRRMEARHPYADVRMVECFLSLPLKYKKLAPCTKVANANGDERYSARKGFAGESNATPRPRS